MPKKPAQGEALVVWTLVVANVLAVLVTYSWIDSSELYKVSREGLAGGLSRALVQLDFPNVALVAIPLALLALDVLPRRAWLFGAPAIALCLVAVWPGVVDPGDLDAKAVNVLPALGVALAFPLTFAAARLAGPGFAAPRAHDRVRVAIAVVVVLVSLPWFAAEIGFHFPPVVFLTDQLYAEPGAAATAAVHLGHHHGFDGTLLVLYALLLSRPRLGGRWVERAYAALVCLGLAYGGTNLVNDLWHEQVVKRGWSSWDVPSATVPRLHVIWALILAASAVVYVFGFARADESGRDPR